MHDCSTFQRENTVPTHCIFKRFAGVHCRGAPRRNLREHKPRNETRSIAIRALPTSTTFQQSQFVSRRSSSSFIPTGQKLNSSNVSEQSSALSKSKNSLEVRFALVEMLPSFSSSSTSPHPKLIRSRIRCDSYVAPCALTLLTRVYNVCVLSSNVGRPTTTPWLSLPLSAHQVIPPLDLTPPSPRPSHGPFQRETLITKMY